MASETDEALPVEVEVEQPRIPRLFIPTDWYWRADDGRIFGSAHQAIVDENDGAFVTWSEIFGEADNWPVDHDGQQSDEALQMAVAPYGIHVTLSDLKAHLKREIDAAAEAERARYITTGAGQAMTYARKVEEAKTLQDDGDPEPEDYPMLSASIGIDGDDLVTVAATVLAMDAAWARIGAGIEAARLAAKAAIGAAETVTAAQAIKADWPQP